jgi:sialidase-1
MSTHKKPGSPLNRRTFFSLAGAAAAGFAVSPIQAIASSEENALLPQQPVADVLPPVPENAVAEVLETKVICRQPGRHLGDGSEYGVNNYMHPIIVKRVIEKDRYMGWPTITRTNDNELLVVFSGDRDAHVCPWGKTQMIRSRNNGKTWSEPEIINNTPLDDRDAGILQTKKGTLLVSWFTSVAFMLPVYKAAFERYARYAEKITPDIKEKWLGNWVRRSQDNGKTWGQPVRTTVTAPHGPIQLRDGRLLYVGMGNRNGQGGVQVEESSDDGLSWKVIATIPKPDFPTSMSEPHMVELASGKLLAMVRNEPKDRTQCFLLQSESTDGGKTWSQMRSSGIWGYPPFLKQLKNGWLVVVYGYRQEPLTERACISRDEGKTWDVENAVTLASAISHDLGYPSIVQLDDDSLLTTFYQASKSGEPTVVMSTHWKLK